MFIGKLDSELQRCPTEIVIENTVTKGLQRPTNTNIIYCGDESTLQQLNLELKK